MMQTEPQTVLIGVFGTPAEAERYAEELRRAGFGDGQIGVATPHPQGADSPVEETALAGALTGGTLGVFAGMALGLGLIPGVGPVLLGGALAALLGGAAVGAAAGGVVGGLIGLGIPEDHARHYERHLSEGRTLVVVQAADRYGEALALLHRHEAHKPPPVPADPRDRDKLG
jgi:hypothetical protein